MVESRPKIRIEGYYSASGDWRPIAVNASGELPISVSVTATADISGQPVSISGQPVQATVTVSEVTVSSGEIHVVSGAVTIVSGQVDILNMPTITTDISGQPVTVSGDIVRTEQYGAWDVAVSGSVTIISGQVDILNMPPITTDISGQAVWVGSGEVTVLSGHVRAEQYGTWGVQVSGAVQVSGTIGATQAGAWNVAVSGSVTVISGRVDILNMPPITTDISGQPVTVSGNIVRSEQYGTWGVQVSGAVQVSGEVVAHVSGETVIARTIATTMSTSVYTVTAASGGTQIATTNTNRKSLIVQNIGVGDIYIKESPLQSGEGIKILSDGSYATNTYVGELWAYATTSGDKVVVSEEA